MFTCPLACIFKGLYHVGTLSICAHMSLGLLIQSFVPCSNSKQSEVRAYVFACPWVCNFNSFYNVVTPNKTRLQSAQCFLGTYRVGREQHSVRVQFYKKIYIIFSPKIFSKLIIVQQLHALILICSNCVCILCARRPVLVFLIKDKGFVKEVSLVIRQNKRYDDKDQISV